MSFFSSGIQSEVPHCISSAWFLSLFSEMMVSQSLLLPFFDTLESTGQIFCRVFLSPMIRLRIGIRGMNIMKVMICPSTCIVSEVRDVDTSPTGDLNLDHFVKLVSAKFLQCVVAIFPSTINKSFGGEALRLPCSQLFTH